MTASPDAPLLELRGVSRRYGPVVALADGTLSCRAGTIHAVMGENGAGKSTLIKIVSGVVQPDHGEILLDGAPVRFAGPADAQDRGIGCVFQELSLLPDLPVTDNIAIARPPRRFGLIDRAAQRREAERLLATIGCTDIDPRARVRDLPLSRRQMVEIAKALGRRPRLLILDEATSALTADDVSRVYALLHRLREEGLCILYISHRMHEIRELADTCSVFANGRHVDTFPQRERTEHDIVRLMIGRELSALYPAKRVFAPDPAAPPAVETEALSWPPRLNGISMRAAPGEILGLGGLDGQGQREFLLSLFGCLSGTGGTVRISGRPVRPRGPRDARHPRLGLALVPEDRKTEGLMLPMSVSDNLTIATLERWRSGPLLDGRRERAAVADIVRRLRIKAVPELPVATLSGGNQQKVAIGKWLLAEPRILLLADPTRGIDVGTKQELYLLLRELADAGTTVILHTTDYDELIGLCDRVLIFYGGRIVRELSGDSLSERDIVSASLDIAPGAAA
ncbi:MAG: sugar ABC transporter ATP-binding protein [Gluconacetobacter diazotrophicus]|nr:sugar ABC transporter ATP-binding protein [Gluconacetobacter diazotrophicus]